MNDVTLPESLLFFYIERQSTVLRHLLASINSMVLTTLMLYAAGAAVLLRSIYLLYQALFGPLKDIPGPFLARFTRLSFLRSIYSGQAHWEEIALHRKHAKDGQFYAPVVRLGPNMFSITRPEKAVYGIGSKMPKSSWYEGWKHP